MKQLKDNLKAAKLQLIDEEVIQLNKVSNLPELYPHRMIQDYGTRILNNSLVSKLPAIARYTGPYRCLL